jgi:hypothetical protein
MENPWFGSKEDVGSTGILTWQGALAVILGIGGGLACHFLLRNDLAAGACVALLILVYLLKYDPDTKSY